MRHFLLIVILMVVAPSLQAATLVTWNFDDADAYGNSSSGTVPFSANGTVDSNITTATIQHSTPADMSGGGYWNDTYGSINWEETSLANAIAADDYYTLNFSAASGFEMDLTALSLVFDSSTTTGIDIAVRSSVDGFSTDVYNWGGDLGAAGHTVTIDLSGGTYDNLSSIEFRIYGWGSTASSNRLAIGTLGTADGVDDIVLQGTVAAVPEPSVYTMLLLGMLGIAGVVFFRKRAAAVAA